jgi:hypothetical protein
LTRTLDREAGDRYRLPQFITKKGSSLKRQYLKLSETEKKNLTRDIEAVREQRETVCRANPKAVQHDVNAIRKRPLYPGMPWDALSGFARDWLHV